MAAFLRQRLGAVGALSGAGLLGSAYWLQQNLDQVQAPVPTAHSEQASPGALDPNSWRGFTLASSEQVTPDTRRFRFNLPEKDQTLGLPVASCFVTRAPLGDEDEKGSKKQVIRPYTPCSEPDTKGYFELVIKAYPNGKMSQHIHNLKEGDSLECKGPIGKLDYKPNMKKKLGMIAGGSGLTPMLQVIQEIVKNPEDNTEATFIFANKTEQDIILKKELDEMAAKSDKLNVVYLLDKPPTDNWQGELGYLTVDMAKKYFPPPSNDNLILVCGPPPMMKAISGDKVSPKDQGELAGVLKEAGYTKDQVYKF